MSFPLPGNNSSYERCSDRYSRREDYEHQPIYYRRPPHYANYDIYQSDRIDRAERDRNDQDRIERDRIERHRIECHCFERESDRNIRERSDFEQAREREYSSYLARTRYETDRNHSGKCCCSRLSSRESHHDGTKGERNETKYGRELDGQKLCSNMDYSFKISRLQGSEELHFKRDIRLLDLDDGVNDPNGIKGTHHQSTIS
eukprot:scaffold66987_cov32-Attheya_sp.AAC.1